MRYAYDANGNRLSRTVTTPEATTTETATYDGQDRLLTYGGTEYRYNGNGDLESTTTDGQTTRYQYDALGNLLKVTKPNDVVVEYLIDGQNRRVGRKVDGVLTHTWQYADQLRIIAEQDHVRGLTKRFVYATRTNTPDYMEAAGVHYRIFADHLGSPRFVVNTSTRQVAQAVSYDEYGNVMADSDPGLIPFGFAGGLYDVATGLTRFGARDYDPRVGRWTAKEPLGFAGSVNFYTYASNDPVNLVDPTGLKEDSASNLRARKAIDRVARKHDGSDAWDVQKKKGPFPAGTNKCNLFVADILDEAGLGYPQIDGRRPQAGEWGNPKLSIPNWRVLGPNEKPEPGDVAAIRFPGGGSPGATGHTGLMISGPNSTVINISAHTSRRPNTPGLVYNDPGQFENQPSTVYRRFTGECSTCR